MVLIEQISALMDFLQYHQDLALGHCSRTNEGRSLSKKYWMECAQILNSISADCPNKTPAEWRTFFNEYKSKMLKKIKAQKSEMSATGGGPAKKLTLTPLQERLYTILGRDVGEPLPGVRHNPLTNIRQLCSASSDARGACGKCATTRNKLRSRKFSQPSTSDQPPKRRKRQRSARRYAAEGRDHAALETAQSRLEALEAIEARNAEATLKQAEAINNLAAAINNQSSTTEKVVNLLDRFVTSMSKKKLRRILISSDSDSD